MKPVCFRCGRTPAEIPEYAEMGAEEGLTPDNFVIQNEGAYNPDNGHFACTDCYIAIGQPSSERGWVAP